MSINKHRLKSHLRYNKYQFWSHWNIIIAIDYLFIKHRAETKVISTYLVEEMKVTKCIISSITSICLLYYKIIHQMVIWFESWVLVRVNARMQRSWMADCKLNWWIAIYLIRNYIYFASIKQFFFAFNFGFIPFSDFAEWFNSVILFVRLCNMLFISSGKWNIWVHDI